MNIQNARTTLRSIAISPWLWGASIAAYVVVVIAILGPVLFASVGADDSYWILEAASKSGGSYWLAFWEPLTHAFEFNGQPRATSLATSERQVLALMTIDLATLFSIPPAVIWAGTKIVLLGMGLVGVAVFLKSLRFRGRGGDIARLQSSSIAFIIIALPLTIALGAKAQNVANLSGWNYYPSLAYGPLAVYLFLAALTLKFSDVLQRNYRRWAVPVVIVMSVIALLVNLSYELIALSIPLSVLVLAIQPIPPGSTWWERWKGKVTVVLALAGTYAVIFFWIRWRISQMACHATDTCYPGSLVEINLGTLWNNFRGAMPGSNAEYAVTHAARFGRDIPVELPSIVLAVLGAALLVVLWACWRARNSVVSEADVKPPNVLARMETRNLLIVVAIALTIAVGTTVITGITQNAVQQLRTPMVAYRSGFITWAALSLAIVVAVRVLLLARWRVVRIGALAAFALVLIVGISLFMPRNIASAQSERTTLRTQTIDAIHWEIALGDVSDVGDDRRCALIPMFISTYDEVIPRVVRTVKGAYSSFEFYRNIPFCSTSVGLE